jgi:primosomal protein N' (replication factor Y)
MPQAAVEPIVEVAVALPVHGTFSYRVPVEIAGLVEVGSRVWVPFGRRRATGFVLGEGGAPPAGAELRAVLDVLGDGPLFTAAEVPLLRWAADYYLHPIGEVVATALPGGLTATETAVFSITDEGRRRRRDPKAPPLVRQVLERLAEGPLRRSEIRRALGREMPRALLGLLERRGEIRRENRRLESRSRPRRERFARLPAGEAARPRPAGKKGRVVAEIEAAGEIALAALARRVPNAGAHLRALAAAGAIELFSRRVFRDPFGEPIAPDAPPAPTPAQAEAIAAVCAALGRGFEVFLLNGVTGSGKTEVYLQVAGRAAEGGRGVLVLVPEIALITQMERRFRARFGEGVAVLHSGLSDGERYDQWCRVLGREARIVIGARSAVFAPLGELGAVIVDEEHDDSYKQEGGMPYHARDLAVLRGRQAGAVVLLGSATPSLQSFYNVRRGKYRELRLPRRVEARPMPAVEVVDLRRMRDLRGPGRFISPELARAMGEALSRGEQVLLFLNRRGYATLAVCAGCGAPLRCRHCDLALTLHRAAEAFHCHACGFSRPAAGAACDACGADKLKRLGLGTEKVEAAAAALFPGARVARMDRDTTRRKGAVLELLKRLRAREIDVLVGTQMVAKGHDFPEITVVGIVCADLTLSFPDFRAGERTFQLLAQVAGRAGRGDRPGRVILQTYNPGHFCITAARDQDFEGFYRREIGFREALGYPPAARMAQLRVAGTDPARVRGMAEELGRTLRALREEDPGFAAVQVMGPVEAAVARVAENYRWQILLKAPGSGILHRFLGRALLDRRRPREDRRAHVAVDVDPVFLL